jgi:hypothetical protein
MFFGLGLLPKIPIGRKQAQAHRCNMLFEFKPSDSPKVAEFLHRYSDVGAVLDVNPRAHEHLENVEDHDQRGVGCRWHGTAINELARYLPRWHQSGRSLERDACKQTDRDQKVNEEQDLPEGVLSYDAEYYVGVASSLPALAAR